MVSDDGLFIKDFGISLQYLTLLLSIIFYSNYKRYTFYRYFILYILIIAIFDILSQTVFVLNNITLFNVYTFFEFNSFALIYYHLIKEKIRLKILKILVICFNVVYFFSFCFDFYILYFHRYIKNFNV